jgi:hypothetical protein
LAWYDGELGLGGSSSSSSSAVAAAAVVGATPPGATPPKFPNNPPPGAAGGNNDPDPPPGAVGSEPKILPAAGATAGADGPPNGLLTGVDEIVAVGAGFVVVAVGSSSVSKTSAKSLCAFAFGF